MPQRSWILVTCATLLAASEPQNIPNRDGLKQAWLEATYAIEPGFTAQNAAQNLKLSFGSSETKLVHGDAAVALRFVGYGRAGQLQPPTAALISSSKNRVEYRRSALIEWYVNDARGLEQGFTVSERVPGNGPVEIALQMSGAVQPRLVSSSEIALLDSEGRATLRYGDLRAWDARGQRLDSRLVVDSNDMVRLIVEDAGAVYPVTIDPTVTQIVLTPSDGASSARFGQSVAISGNTAIVGASFAGGQTGAAYVFVFSNGAWSQQAKLTVVGGSSADLFGTSVSLDGQTAVIGASGNNTTQGAAFHIYRLWFHLESTGEAYGYRWRHWRSIRHLGLAGWQPLRGACRAGLDCIFIRLELGCRRAGVPAGDRSCAGRRAPASEIRVGIDIAPPLPGSRGRTAPGAAD